MKIIRTTLCLLCGLAVFIQADTILNLSKATLDSLLLAGGSTKNTITTEAQPIASIDFNTNGLIEIPKFPFPKQAFSIECHFFLRQYYPYDPYIAEILAAFDCNYNGNGVSEGVDFRIGGGYNYPLRINDSYDSVSDWARPDYLTKMQRATMSTGIGEFGLGSGTYGAWKEIYTNRCIKTNVWTHFVATFDGTQMKVYLDGFDATDTWRTNGSGLSAFIKDTSTIFFGTENLNALRHFNGKIDFVKIYDKALSESEVRNNFINTLDGNACVNSIIVEYPKAGDVITGSTTFKFSIPSDNPCSTSINTRKWYVQFCSDPSFTDSIRSFECDSSGYSMQQLLNGAKFDSNGIYFFRIIADTSKSSHGSNSDNSLSIQSAPIPAYLIATSTKIKKAATISLKKTNSISGQEAIYDICGRKVGLHNFNNGMLKHGVYFSKANGTASKKLLLIK